MQNITILGIIGNSLLIGLVSLSNSLSTSQRDSTKTEIVFSGCYCPLNKSPYPDCSLQWSACSGPIFFPGLISFYCNGLLSFPPMVPLPLGSHARCSFWLKSPSITSRVLTLTHMFVTVLDLTYSRNDAWWRLDSVLLWMGYFLVQCS